MRFWVGFLPIWTADSNSTWKTMSDDGFRSAFLSIFENLVIWQFGYPAFYQKISNKSTFEPITTPLKWVLADAACKVSMIFLNIASVWAGHCKMGCQNTEFYSRVLLFENAEKIWIFMIFWRCFNVFLWFVLYFWWFSTISNQKES